MQRASGAGRVAAAGVLGRLVGQFEFWNAPRPSCKCGGARTLLIIFVLLYLTFRRFDEALLIMAHVAVRAGRRRLAAVVLGHNLSVASAVGFIALAGVAAEFGVIMLLYLKQAWERRLASGRTPAAETLLDRDPEGAVQRVRPKAMTVAVILAGLLPIMFGATGTGSEVMQRIAAPMVGGMISAPLLSMLVIPVAYRLLRPKAPRGNVNWMPTRHRVTEPWSGGSPMTKSRSNPSTLQ
jgi:Cu(I)/Ag(I) efflux system membrane protein CusA/SilA